MPGDHPDASVRVVDDAELPEVPIWSQDRPARANQRTMAGQQNVAHIHLGGFRRGSYGGAVMTALAEASETNKK